MVTLGLRIQKSDSCALKTLVLVLPYLEPLSLRTRTKLRKSPSGFSVFASYRFSLKVKTN